MNRSVPDSKRIEEIWEAVKNRSIPVKSLTKAEYDVLDEAQKNANILYVVLSADQISLVYKTQRLTFDQSFTLDDTISFEDGVLGVTTPVQGVLSLEEFDALPNEQQNKGLYVISDAGGNSGGGSPSEVYSTEETIIGTWIDGKPLYRRVLNATTPASGTPIVSYNSWGVKEIVKLTGYITPPGNGGRYYLPGIWANSQEYFFVDNEISHKEILLVTGNSSTFRNSPCVLIVEYTKTTD